MRVSRGNALLQRLSLAMIITLSLLASVDVFKSGADGYNCYRIPSMITLPGGRIFAFAEGRLHDCYDGPNHKIDVALTATR